MSFARIWDDCFRCDVFVERDHVGTYYISVADKRLESSEPRPEPPAVSWSPEHAEEWRQALIAYSQACARWREGAHETPIGLPCDGRRFEFGWDDALSCAEKLEELRSMGYRVPQYAIDEVLGEAEPGELGQYWHEDHPAEEEGQEQEAGGD